MTEAEWLVCASPSSLIAELGNRITPRTARLVSCACCRLLWWEFLDSQTRNAVTVAEHYADGLATIADLDAAVVSIFEDRLDEWLAQWMVNKEPRSLEFKRGQSEVLMAVRHKPMFVGCGDNVTKLIRCQVIRDIGGNPFNPITSPDADLLTPAVLDLAQEIYDQGSFSRLGDLADMLAQTGCTDAGLLGHLRRVGCHVKGCHALDALLGKG